MTEIDQKLESLASTSEAPTIFIVLIWLCFTSRPLKVVELNDLVRFASSQTALASNSGLAQQPLQESVYHAGDVQALFHGHEDIFLISSGKKGANSLESMFPTWDPTTLSHLVADQGNSNYEIADDYPMPAIYSNYDMIEIRSPQMKDYLTSKQIRDGAASRFAIQESDAHVYIARTTLEYLSQFNRTDSLDPRTSLDLPAALYCANVWDHHVKLASEAGKYNQVQDICLSAIRSATILENMYRLSSSKPESILSPSRQMDIPTPLMYASQKGLKMLCHTLIEGGAELRNETGWSSLRTPLITAASYGHTDVVELLLDAGVPVDDQQNFQSHTALQQASDRGHLETVKLLLDRGADIDLIGFDNKTAIESAAHMASISGDIRPGGKEREAHFKNVVNFLLDRGARPRTAIVYIAGMDDTNLMIRLLDSGIDINIANSVGRTALTEAITHGQTEHVKLLLERGATTTGNGFMNRTLMQLALARGEQNVIQMLLEAGVSLSATIFSARNIETIAFLLGHGFDVNSKDQQGSTYLHYAVSHQSSDVIKLLLENGADVNVKDDRGRTPIYRTAFGMESRKSPRNFELLLEAGADIEARDPEGITPLIDAGTLGRLDHLQRLLSAGADPLARDLSGANVLLMAAASGNADVVEYLLNYELDVNAVDHHARSVLHYAIMNKRIDSSRNMVAEESKWGDSIMRKIALANMQNDATKLTNVVDLLLKRGARVSAADIDGMTPLHFAARQGFVAVVEILLRNGADVLARSNNGSDALALAQEANYEAVVNILQQPAMKDV